MDRLGQVTLQNTVTLKLDYLLDSQALANNFGIILDCLKQLKEAQDGYDGKLASFMDRLGAVEKGLRERQESNNHSDTLREDKNSQETSKMGQGDRDELAKLIQQLGARVDKNEQNTLENIKDINLLNKDVVGLKEELAKLKNLGQGDKGDSEKGGLDLGAESINNINQEILRNREDTQKLRDELEKVKTDVTSLRDRLDALLKDSTIEKYNEKEKQAEKTDNNGASANKGSEVSRAEFNQLRDKVGILQKKTSGLQLATEDLGKEQQNLQKTDEELNAQIEQLRKLIETMRVELDNQKRKEGEGGEDSKGREGVSREELERLQKLVEKLRKEVEEMRKEQNAHSKTSIEEDSGSKGRFDKASYTQNRFRDDDSKLRELIARVDYLEKMMGSKNSINQDQQKNDKLPMIRRPNKGRDVSTHEKSTVKRDMAEIKNELQAWLNSYLASLKSKDNFEDLELKIQEVKNALGKKADQEGMKKGLMFLESKINQLYLFLTEPDGEDAMIVRKGFNCLSCSKKVEKLRGKLGPHINWNNMTATNYSPPKVGYSRHQGDSPDRQDDL